MEDKDKFMQYVSNNYQYLQKKMRSWAFNTHRQYSEDIFHTTILRIYDYLKKNGKAKDNSDYGFESLFFRSFSTNTDRETQYAYNKYRDNNQQDNKNLFDAYESFKENNEITVEEKIDKDLFTDFSINFLLKQVEDNFDIIDYRLFKIKLFMGCTYKKIIEITNIKDAKQRIIKINNWIKDNIHIKDIEKQYEKYKNSL